MLRFERVVALPDSKISDFLSRIAYLRLDCSIRFTGGSVHTSQVEGVNPLRSKLSTQRSKAAGPFGFRNCGTPKALANFSPETMKPGLPKSV